MVLLLRRVLQLLLVLVLAIVKIVRCQIKLVERVDNKTPLNALVIRKSVVFMRLKESVPDPADRLAVNSRSLGQRPRRTPDGRKCRAVEPITLNHCE